VAHAPTRKELKNTADLLAVVAELRAAGLDLELELIDDAPHAECLRRKARCHMVFDHMQGYYGMSSLESLAQGVPVVAGLDDWCAGHMREFADCGELPWIVARDRAALAAALARLARDPEPARPPGAPRAASWSSAGPRRGLWRGWKHSTPGCGRQPRESAVRSALSPTGPTLVVPCRNCAAFIGPCLDSVLAQEYTAGACWWPTTHPPTPRPTPCAPIWPTRASPGAAARARRAHGQHRGSPGPLAPGPAEVVAILDGDDTLLPEPWRGSWPSKRAAATWSGRHGDRRSRRVHGRALLPGVPVRQQLWCLSQLRSFKGYLLRGLPPEYMCDPEGGPCRAAGDLALYFALIERAGAAKAAFVPEKLYRYREHAGNNCRARRAEQLANNRHLRALAPLPMQTEFFDFTETLPDPDGSALDKLGLREFGRAVRARYPEPYSVRVRHVVPRALADSWRAYHGLWIAEGIYLDGAEGGESADGTDAAAP
jgi:hypothetical protein